MLITTKRAIPEDHESDFGVPQNVYDTLGNSPPIFVYLPECGTYVCALINENDMPSPSLFHVVANPQGEPRWEKHRGFTEPVPVAYLVEDIKHDDDFLQTVNEYFKTKFCHCDFEGHDCLEHNVKNAGPTSTGPILLTFDN